MPESKIVSYRKTIALLLFATACATQSQTNRGQKIADPAIEVEQEVGPAELNYPEGPIELKYDLQITNNWTQPMTVVRVNVATINPAGASYQLRRDFYNVRATIPPGDTRVVPFWAKGYSFGRGPRDTEPISLRLIVYFETPEGNYQKVMMTELQQGSY